MLKTALFADRVIMKLIFLLIIHGHPKEGTTLTLNIALVPVLWSHSLQAIDKYFRRNT